MFIKLPVMTSGKYCYLGLYSNFKGLSFDNIHHPSTVKLISLMLLRTKGVSFNSVIYSIMTTSMIVYRADLYDVCKFSGLFTNKHLIQHKNVTFGQELTC